MKVIKKMAIGIVAVLILLFGYLYYFQPISILEPKAYEPSGEAVLEELLREEAVGEDAKELIKLIEETHPRFLEGRNDRYDTAKVDFLNGTTRSMTTRELQLEASRYLASLEDGHTAIYWNEENELDIDWAYIDGKLMVLDEKGQLTDKRVVRIGERDIDYLINEVKGRFSAENYSAESMLIAGKLKGKIILESLGIAEDRKVTIVVNDGKDYDKIELQYIPIREREASSEIYGRRLSDETFYIKLGVCVLNDGYRVMINDLKAALSEGVTSVIVDVRDNPGGNSEASTNILETLGMETGSYGGVVRFSPLAKKYRGYLRSSGSIKFRGSNHSKKNNHIDLYVLTNEKTFSSAQILVTLVRDGDLGTIVGRPSANSPSSYGDVISFQLSNSKLQGQVSHKKFIRPDESKADEKILIPDINLGFGEDALERVLKIIDEN